MPRITGASIYIVRIDGRHPVIVEIHTDAGISGVGEAAVAYGVGATAAAGMIKDLMDAMVLGKDPFRIEALWSEMYDHSFWAKGGGPIVFAGIAAIEQALWDIKGKALGVPVYELLGGKCRDSVRMYANGWSFRANSAEDFARAAEKHLYTRYGFRRVFELRAADIVQPDIGNSGGIMETRKIAAMAEAFDMRIQPHLCGGPVLTAATLQLDACLTNLLIQEVYPYRVPEHFGIVDRAPELEIRNGYAPIPDRPG